MRANFRELKKQEAQNALDLSPKRMPGSSSGLGAHSVSPIRRRTTLRRRTNSLTPSKTANMPRRSMSLTAKKNVKKPPKKLLLKQRGKSESAPADARKSLQAKLKLMNRKPSYLADSNEGLTSPIM